MSAIHETDEQDEPDARLRFRATGLGHSYVTDRDPREGERTVYLHRLAAVAWGVLDGLDDDRHVHHEVPEEWTDDHDREDVGIPWLTTEDVLVAETPTEHSEIHLR